ncbi:hypothetical protein [Mucilaginibacter celer]|uniref:Uncharacterized protein n=1 Tax=Mucilaginibacter celer TaxID=2305508 RepID=A0A494VYV9_9SPHI|nr:hypothetical protein [Mucilaginibacter celer]AYL96335.1 hypothetical protein HYN43_013980 [Mucilaginibacter celer]
MVVDLISRALYLRSKGDNTLFEKVSEWLENSLVNPTSKFSVENEMYYSKEISSAQFQDIIDEDESDWFLMYSESFKFMAIAKKRTVSENLIGEKAGIYITTLWIIKSNIKSLNVDQEPILIYTPYRFDWSKLNLAYDFKMLMIKLLDPRVKLMQMPSYAAPEWVSWTTKRA